MVANISSVSLQMFIYSSQKAILKKNEFGRLNAYSEEEVKQEKEVESNVEKP